MLEETPRDSLVKELACYRFFPSQGENRRFGPLLKGEKGSQEKRDSYFNIALFFPPHLYRGVRSLLLLRDSKIVGFLKLRTSNFSVCRAVES